MFKTITAVCIAAAFSTPAIAKTINVEMLNHGPDGAFVFEPEFIKAEPGDVIHFIAKDKGHDVESIPGMLPEGVKPFRSKFSKDFDLTVTTPGLYGFKCMPHYPLGMVGLIEVGTKPANLAAAKAVHEPGKAGARMAELMTKVQ